MLSLSAISSAMLNVSDVLNVDGFGLQAVCVHCTNSNILHTVGQSTI